MYYDIVEAHNRIKQYIKFLPLYYSNNFSEPYDSKIYFKLENLQRTGSFKIRGALNSILKNIDYCKDGVVAASAGNHAQGVAFGSKVMGIKSTIVMPEHTPLVKIANTSSLGAEVILHGKSYDEAYKRALDISKERQHYFIHPFNDLDVIAGQGSIAHEILEEFSDIDMIITPIGGGGLISGIAAYVKHVKPNIKIIGVQAENASGMMSSVRRGSIVRLISSNTIAEGIAVKEVGDITFDFCRRYVDEIISVSENDIARAVLQYLERSKLVVEGAGAVPLAAILAGKINVKGKTAVLILSGGNIDVNLISRIINKGLASTGRYLDMSIILKDSPGSLSDVTKLVAECGANIIDIRHFRYDVNLPIGFTKVNLELETKGSLHIESIISAFTDKGYEVNING